MVEPPYESVHVLGLKPSPSDPAGSLPVQFKYSSIYVEFVKNPQDCKTSDAFYRKTMPRLEVPLPITARPSDCDALVFFHKRHGGVFILLATTVVMGSFIFGAVWSKSKDPVLGWTIALTGGAVLIGYLTMIATLHSS